ncbi:MAG: hypothetical protein MI723_14970, partial [Caulobacterales bacterium]|nr:hypothetical protein [Caulobacterales bacterium]
AAAAAIVDGMALFRGAGAVKQPDDGSIPIGGDADAAAYERQLLKNRAVVDQAALALERHGGSRPYFDTADPQTFKDDCRRAAQDLRTGPAAYRRAADSLASMGDLCGAFEADKDQEAGRLFQAAAGRLRSLAEAHEAFRAAQRAYFDVIKHETMAVAHDPEEAATRRHRNAMLASGEQPVWRVSDFVTLGSPLNFGPFLLAENYGDFAMSKRDGELPICPPFLEASARRGGESPDFADLCFSHRQSVIDMFGRLRVNPHFGPNHSAVFAPVRWTNLFFPQEGGPVTGDIISGPCWRHFDLGVADIAVDRHGTGQLFAHNEYWTTELSNEALEALSEEQLPQHLRALRRALDLAGPPQPPPAPEVPDIPS